MRRSGWTAPLYWERRDGALDDVHARTAASPLDPAAPVSHLSYFEADAYARWAGARLPTEAEWEVGRGRLRRRRATSSTAARCIRSRRAPTRAPATPRQLFGDVWEWTASAYAPYPGFRPPPGAVGEYNGKFMCNQYVLRGGSCATPRAHIRATYRNFFPPDARWQFTGLRLARDAR